MKQIDLNQIQPYLWEIPQEGTMEVPALVFATDELIPALTKDRCLHQLKNVASLEGIQMAAIVMPDAHEGYGFPIGGIAATRYPDGVISPGGIGYDINCGVRLLRTPWKFPEIKNQLSNLATNLDQEIPSGVGKGGQLKLSIKELDDVLTTGAEWAVNQGYGLKEDLNYLESNGKLTSANPSKVSEKAKLRGKNQLGTIGAGNHFVEVDRVQNIFHQQASQAFGLEPNQVVVLIHTGSRGLGHQVATDYLKVMMKAMPKYQIHPPDRELACVPFNSPEGQDYFAAMCAAANFAWCNREMITWEVRKAFKKTFGRQDGIEVVYDVSHNIAKIEEHLIEGKQSKVIVHRKGATRAFGPGFSELPLEYQNVGQPVLIPGSMGTSSYVLAGTKKSMELSFGSTCHGAGRAMSRRAAKRLVNAPSLIQNLAEKGIHIKAGSFAGAAEEAPQAYKDVDLVVEAVQQAGIAQKVAQLKPLVVIKG